MSKKSGKTTHIKIESLNDLKLSEPQLRSERIAHFENLKKLANQFLSENKSEQGKRTHKWEKGIIEYNIKHLTRVIQNADHELKDVQLTTFVNNELQTQQGLIRQKSFLAVPHILNHLTKTKYGSERFEVYRYSTIYSMAYDFHWITDGTVGEQIAVVNGTKPPSIYVKYIPEKSRDIAKRVIPFFIRNPQTQSVTKLLDRILALVKSKDYLASNILLMVAIESLVRQLATEVYSKQNPGISPDQARAYTDGHQSLETLIIKGDWKPDLPIKVAMAFLLSRQVSDPHLEASHAVFDKYRAMRKDIDKGLEKLEQIIRTKPQYDHAEMGSQLELLKVLVEKLPDIQNEEINISLRTKLLFLTRRFKEDRNALIHGNFESFNVGWKTYLYLLAIIKVFEVYEEYKPGKP